MTLTRQQAVDEILALFKAAWEAQATPPKVLWPGVEGDIPSGSPAAPWARVTLEHTDRSQVAWAGEGKKRYTQLGLITIQIFVPFGKGLSAGNNLATIAVEAFQGKTTAGGAFFPTVRAREVGRDGPWHQTNVVAAFSYDEVK